MVDSIERIKCGQIFILSNNNFVLRCEFCGRDICYALDDFHDHVKEHFPDSEDDGTDSDCEYVPPDTKENLVENLANYVNDGSQSTSPAAESLLVEREWFPSSGFNELSDGTIPNEQNERHHQQKPIQSSHTIKNENISDANRDNVPDESTRTFKESFEIKETSDHNEASGSNIQKLPKKRYVCNICHKQFQSKQRVSDHTNTHSGKRPYKCKICMKTFTAHDTWAKHVKEIHELDLRHACTVCGKKFLTLYRLNMHIKEKHLHDTDPHRFFTCTMCEEKFRSYGQLVYHRRMVHTKKPVIILTCDHCKRQFHRRAYLLRHMKLHSGTNEYGCKHCHKAFSTSSGKYHHKKKCGKQRNITAA